MLKLMEELMIHGVAFSWKPGRMDINGWRVSFGGDGRYKVQGFTDGEARTFYFVSPVLVLRQIDMAGREESSEKVLSWESK